MDRDPGGGLTNSAGSGGASGESHGPIREESTAAPPLLHPKALVWIAASFLFGYFLLGAGAVLGSFGGGPAVLLALAAAPPISCLLAAAVHRGRHLLTSSIGGIVFAGAAALRMRLWSSGVALPDEPSLASHLAGLLLLALPLYLLWGTALRASLSRADGREEFRALRLASILALGYGIYGAAFVLWFVG